MEFKQITDEEEKKHLYRTRYKVFVDVMGDKNHYPDRLYVDPGNVDDWALHFACYEGADILGGVSLLLKSMAPDGYLPVEKDNDLVCEKESCEFTNLIMVDEYIGNNLLKRGRVLRGLAKTVFEAVKDNSLTHAYLEAHHLVKPLYNGLGFEQVGPLHTYKTYFQTFPMKGSFESIKNSGLMKLGLLST